MNVMTLKLDDKELERKLNEADCALNRVFCYIEGIGEIAKPKISLFIERAGDDGKNNTGRV